MKNLKKILIGFFSILALMTLNSCTKSDTTPSTNSEVPSLTTTLPSSIATTTALCGGTVIADGGATITALGVVWSTSTNPTVALATKTVDGTGTDTFVSSITGLTANTTYYVRAYATNSSGTAYGNEQSFSTSTSSATVTDIDGNNYALVTIGTQIWTKTNLNVSKYRNGDIIPQVQNPTSWSNLTTGAWCYYNNDTANGPVYGKLYNWYAVHDPRGLAPTGYHVPTDAEWTILTTFLGGDLVAGNKLKEAGTAHWIIINTATTNSSGFTGLPGGYISNIGGSFNLNSGGFWWTASESNATFAWYRVLYYSSGNVGWPTTSKKDGYSVRCIKD